jgi:hypothetical protein
MSYRHTDDQLDCKKRDKVVDQGAGLSADQLKGVSQEWHDHLRKLECDVIIPQPEEKKKIQETCHQPFRIDSDPAPFRKLAPPEP